VRHVFETLRWGRINKGSFVVTLNPSANVELALNEWIGMGRLRTVDEVDVKNLLEMGRLVVEKEALDYLLFKHQSDLVKPPGVAKGAELPASLISREISAAQQAMLNEGVSMEQVEEALAAQDAAESAIMDESQWEDVDDSQFPEVDEMESRDMHEVKENDNERVSTR
jgi:large subunit ribosomal protein L4